METQLHFDYLQVPYRVKIAITPRAFFIYNAKIASRFLDFNLPKPGVFFEVLPTSLKLEESQLNVEEDLGREYISQIHRDWENIVNQTSEKRLTIIYRNPIERLITAIVQDTWYLLETHRNHPLLYSSLTQSGFTTSDIDKLTDYYTKSSPGRSSSRRDDNFVEIDMNDMTQTIPKMIYHLYNMYIDNLFKRGGFESGHVSSHNLQLVTILETKKLNIDEIKFINLDNRDNSLAEYLSTIEIPTSSDSYQNSNSIFGKHIVEEMIYKVNPDVLHDIFSGEIYSYHILESYRNKSKYN